MAHFYQLKGDKATFDKCLSAIKSACSTELWLDSLIQSSEKRGSIDSGHNVLLHWWKSFKDENIDFIYENVSKDRAEYYYEDSTGKLLHIAEQCRDNAHVYHAIGFPDSIVEELEGSSHEKLYYLLDTKISQFINEDDFEMKIKCTNNA